MKEVEDIAESAGESDLADQIKVDVLLHSSEIRPSRSDLLRYYVVVYLQRHPDAKCDEVYEYIASRLGGNPTDFARRDGDLVREELQRQQNIRKMP